MTGNEIDQLFRDWLAQHRPPEIADQYETNSLLTPATNPAELNDAIDDMLERLSRHFGAGESFMSTDYHEARAALALPDDRTPVPEAFAAVFEKPSANSRHGHAIR